MTKDQSQEYKQLSQERFGRYAQGYVASQTHAAAQELAALIEMADPQPDWLVLDIATGGGHTALAFAPHVQKVIAADLTRKMLTWGAGPRSVQALLLGGKTRAALSGRHYVSAEDVRALAHPVLRHRLVTNFSAEAEGYTTDRIVDELLASLDPTKTSLDEDERLSKVLST